MPAITASMVAELRAKTDAPMMECKKAPDRGRRRRRARRRDPARQARQQGRQGGRRITAEGVVAAAVGARPARWSRSTARPTSSPRTTLPGLRQGRRRAGGQHNPADMAALSALPYSQDGFGPTLEDVRKGLIGKIGERTCRSAAASSASSAAPAGALPARHAHRRGRRVRRRRHRRQGRGDARRRDEAGRAVVGRGAGRAGREGERKIAAEKAAESGKPAEIVAKMVEGSVQKFLKEVSLLDQVFVKAADGKQTVGAMLKAAKTDREGLHPVRGGRRHREEGRRLRGRSGGPGRRGQGA